MMQERQVSSQYMLHQPAMPLQLAARTRRGRVRGRSASARVLRQAGGVSRARLAVAA